MFNWMFSAVTYEESEESEVTHDMVYSGFHSWILSHISDFFAHDPMYVMCTFSSGSLHPRSLSAGMKRLHSPQWNMFELCFCCSHIYIHVFICNHVWNIHQPVRLSVDLPISFKYPSLSSPEVMWLFSLLSPNTLSQQFSTVGCHPLWVVLNDPFTRVTYQIPCISGTDITIHKSSKITVMK